ncbi:repressor of RNA polymerase III transcription MAF1 homolog isoform X1 [Poecile atricapillus]|uniref:repressor of RNA polymerase III transcription MAF1 homolog isoform X1 n=1 Tax=Poecile atricapillus TaxID=48891 RepID=UPI002739313D|nr:repressor of RNA polymerase III transcription MAF1 homolog isoform X1 [Poecile atricapillus]
MDWEGLGEPRVQPRTQPQLGMDWDGLGWIGRELGWTGRDWESHEFSHEPSLNWVRTGRDWDGLGGTGRATSSATSPASTGYGLGWTGSNWDGLGGTGRATSSAASPASTGYGLGGTGRDWESHEFSREPSLNWVVNAVNCSLFSAVREDFPVVSRVPDSRFRLFPVQVVNAVNCSPVVSRVPDSRFRLLFPVVVSGTGCERCELQPVLGRARGFPGCFPCPSLPVVVSGCCCERCELQPGCFPCPSFPFPVVSGCCFWYRLLTQ